MIIIQFLKRNVASPRKPRSLGLTYIPLEYISSLIVTFLATMLYGGAAHHACCPPPMHSEFWSGYAWLLQPSEHFLRPSRGRKLSLGFCLKAGSDHFAGRTLRMLLGRGPQGGIPTP